MKKSILIFIFLVLLVPGLALAKSHHHNGHNAGYGYYGYGSNIPNPQSYTDYYNTFPWYNPPYEPYQYKFHVLPNGDAYFSTPGTDYLPYISRGGSYQPLDYGQFMNGYFH